MKPTFFPLLLSVGLVCGQDSVIVFNEIHYHPTSDNSSLEYVELHNQLAIDTDISNWRLDGDVCFNFPEGTTIPARGYLVVAKDPSALQAATGQSGALGPYDGFLSNSGNTLRLYNNNRSFRITDSAPPEIVAETLWNVDLQGNGNGGALGQLAPPLDMTGEATGLGGTWNHLTIGGHPTTSSNPSLALVKSDGSSSSVNFNITGTVSGWSQAGNPLFSDYLFVNAGNADASIDWRITGLDSGESYSLILYGGVARDIQITIDTDGDGSLADETSVFAPAGGSVIIEDISPFPGANSLILGRAEGGTNGEGNWGGFQLLIPDDSGGGNGGASLGGVPNESLDSRRIMDELDYSDTAPWPIAPDGSGFTLAKIDPMAGTSHPENWSFSSNTNGTPGSANATASTAAFVFNEASGSMDANFQVELYNGGTSPIDYGNFVLSSSDPLHSDYLLPVGTLAPGAFLSLDTATLGFSPADNNRLFLFSPGKASLLDTLRVDDRAWARFPDGSSEWFRPDLSTPGAANQVTFEEGLVINEIFYHAYPDRRIPTSSPPITTTVLNFDSTWRYHLDAGASGLPSNWATTSHPVDDVSWDEGPGLLGRETSTLGEPIGTEITLSPKITYYFETEFNYSGTTQVSEMTLNHYFDDGAVIYLNGIEIARVGMPGGTITPTTPASPGIGNASLGS
ncbi:MAG: lamin tail domain-containing protein, partial [Akkermansiaceae bacterium]